MTCRTEVGRLGEWLIRDSIIEIFATNGEHEDVNESFIILETDMFVSETGYPGRLLLPPLGIELW